ncbi:FAD-binding oxidoreductase [Marivita sp.]|jgi:D-amino-acid dehydrogenase|uniref:NAD(P)/FAD-dependent oxidoreductase n=1 Tax=Marivita sp. TaxID=2003365 RepID=UPI00321C376D
MTKSVIVIGAGIVGVSSAIWLRRFGQEVTLVDRDGPGQGTSFGNAGLLAACAMVPVTTPGLITKAPKMVFDPDSPLFLRWSYLPRIAPWLVRYLKHANDRDTRRIAADLTDITADTVDQHFALTEGLAARDYLCKSDYVHAYSARAEYEADRYSWELRREHGFVPAMIEGPAVQEFDPSFGPSITCLAVVKNHGFVTNPGGYVAALAREFEQMGGRIIKATVQDIETAEGERPRLITSVGALEADSVVLASGAWSKGLMAKLGLNIPLESERGYHIVMKDASGGPRVPSMISSAKFVATPMQMGLRCAGIVELGGLEAGPSDAPFALLRRKIAEAFPHLLFDREETWMGHRPATTDSLPLIGEVRNTGVFTAFGHQHVGLTAGPKTGRLVAGLIADQPSNLDLQPFSPHRFGA